MDQGSMFCTFPQKNTGECFTTSLKGYAKIQALLKEKNQLKKSLRSVLHQDIQLLSRSTALTHFVSSYFSICVDGMFCALHSKVLTTDLLWHTGW